MAGPVPATGTRGTSGVRRDRCEHQDRGTCMETVTGRPRDLLLSGPQVGLMLTEKTGVRQQTLTA